VAQVEGDAAGHEELGEGQGQPIPGRQPRLQEIGAPGAYMETSGQGRQQPAAGPQSPPEPGRDYVPQRLEGRQGRHQEAFGQEHHDQAGHRQEQLGAGSEAARPVKARRGPGKFISLHRDVTFPKIRI
jgi:hypothetical protein